MTLEEALHCVHGLPPYSTQIGKLSRQISEWKSLGVTSLHDLSLALKHMDDDAKSRCIANIGMLRDRRAEELLFELWEEESNQRELISGILGEWGGPRIQKFAIGLLDGLDQDNPVDWSPVTLLSRVSTEPIFDHVSLPQRLEIFRRFVSLASEPTYPGKTRAEAIMIASNLADRMLSDPAALQPRDRSALVDSVRQMIMAGLQSRHPLILIDAAIAAGIHRVDQASSRLLELADGYPARDESDDMVRSVRLACRNSTVMIETGDWPE